jgi:hypothetical protein
MKTSVTESSSSSKQHGYRYWIIRIAILLGLPVLLYYGYCWGLWGRHSLLLQYLFQCSCPPVSEEARYPKDMDVVVSACRYRSSILSPSGRLLAVYENESTNASPYLLDLRTGEKIPIHLPEKSGITFLTDNLLYVSLSYEEKYVLDRTTGSQYPVQRFLSVYPGTFVAGNADLNLLAEALGQAKFIFFREQDDMIIALDPDFPASAGKNFIIDQFGIPGKNPDRTEQFLRAYNIVYQIIPSALLEEVVSPDKRFIAHPEGIYMLETGQRIVEGPYTSRFYRPYSGKYFSVRGWIYDGRAVIYSEIFKPCLIETTLITIDPMCFIKVPQPVLKLKVPEEYWLSQETP